MSFGKLTRNQLILCAWKFTVNSALQRSSSTATAISIKVDQKKGLRKYLDDVAGEDEEDEENEPLIDSDDDDDDDSDN